LIPKFETNVISIATVYPEHHQWGRKYRYQKIEDAISS
jgi:hypothetical protein